MSESCTHDCNTCQADCGDRATDATSFLEVPHELSNIKKVIGVVSGKGGVGKSLVTSMLAVLMRRRGLNTAILDADITGPSIPKAFGVTRGAKSTDIGLFPAESKLGIRIMSLNLLVEKETAPVVWRGPIIAGMVKQFWTDVVWGDVDYMFVDMPPGTGDVPLTVFQSVPLDGIVVVTSPQSLVGMVVEKAVSMARMMGIPILGFVENMSYLNCPDCGREISPFGESKIEELSRRHGVDAFARIPITPGFAAACDEGLIELFEGDYLDGIAGALDSLA
ncbi:Mrp/NBP35 family ATP-binding protein [Oscillospiraceae bacterium OttesenSCG-928-G22]|nr:Mrp/NBP35 family ATP-binding protein [Oscillospiraceae bacterium OttesenSCG-928-G22]